MCAIEWALSPTLAASAGHARPSVARSAMGLHAEDSPVIGEIRGIDEVALPTPHNLLVVDSEGA